jgi:hypothetical protein
LKNRNDWAAIRHQRMQTNRIPRPASLPALPLLQSEAIPQKDDPLFGAALDQLPASGKTCHPAACANGWAQSGHCPAYLIFARSKSILYQESSLAITRAGYINAIIATSSMGNDVIA